MKVRLHYLLVTVSFVCSLIIIINQKTSAQSIAPNQFKGNPLRPTTISWGGYSNQNQLIGADNQWEFVQKYMDAFLMHGAYWEKNTGYEGVRYTQSQVDSVLVALGKALKKYGKYATVETGFGENDKDYNPEDSRKREAVTRAKSDIESLKHFATFGVNVSKLRVDWFPMSAAATYSTKFNTLSPRNLLLRVTGANEYWGEAKGVDPNNANWREYIRLMNEAYPNIEFAIDQAPCNFFKAPYDSSIRKLVPWQGFGFGYNGLKTIQHRQVLNADGKPAEFHLDFADIMMSVAMLTRSLGMNYYGFEGDTPYSYVTDNKGRMGKELMPFLLAIEQMGHKYGFHSGKIINDNVPTDTYGDHDEWDLKFHDRSLQYLETYQAAGGRADQYIFESWYHGPYTLFPETKLGTFSNLAKDAIRRVRGIDDDGKPFNIDLAIRKKGDKKWIGQGIYEQKEAKKQLVEHSFERSNKPVTFELTITNNAKELNKGDARATPLVRAVESGNEGWVIAYITPDGKDVTDEINAAKSFDGWFTGGIEPGETKTLLITIQPTDTSIKKEGTIHLQLYWNPQDPQQLVRDVMEIRVSK